MQLRGNGFAYHPLVTQRYGCTEISMIESMIGCGTAVYAVGIMEIACTHGEVQRAGGFILQCTECERRRDVMATEKILAAMRAVKLLCSPYRCVGRKKVTIVGIGRKAKRIFVQISEIIFAFTRR